MEIAPGIHSMSQRKGGRVHAFLLDDGQSLTLIDTLYDTDGHRVLEELASMGRTVSDIDNILTLMAPQMERPRWCEDFVHLRAARGTVYQGSSTSRRRSARARQRPDREGRRVLPRAEGSRGDDRCAGFWPGDPYHHGEI